MTPLRIDGHRVPCRICRRRYAAIQWKVTNMAVCAECNRAFFIGVVTGQNILANKTEASE